MKSIVCSCCSFTFVDKKSMNSSGLCKPCYNKQWRKNNVSKFVSLNKEWYLKNKEYKNSYSTKYQLNREKRDLLFKIKRKLRSRLWHAINYNYSTGEAIDNLGCSLKDFKLYMESKFQSGMTWDNWSLHGWHVDHIKPLCNFNLANQEELKKACHYTNLQPLWSNENWLKGGKNET